jgi:DNA polymerase-3 subunit delta
MPEIHYKALKEHLNEGSFVPVYLIYGEEFLYKSAFEALLDAMLPGPSRTLNYEPVFGTQENIQDVIERVNTYSLLSGTKVVTISDSRIFYSKQDEKQLLERAKEEYDNEDFSKAAKFFLSVLEILSLTLDDVKDPKTKEKLNQDLDKVDDSEWLEKLAAFCRDNRLSVPVGEGQAKVLKAAIEKGFPAGNHLIITTDLVDKRQSLFKAIKKYGVVIDCSVPKGDRKADKTVQESVLKDEMKKVLKLHNKTMDKAAYLAMYEMTGFDLRTFSSNLEKLIDFVGDRTKIIVEDVEDALRRSKIDPVYELTNAISDRQTENAMYFLDSLLVNNVHPLQILAAMTNLVRRLLLMKGFVESSHGSSWNGDNSYSDFQNRVLPAIQAYDKTLQDLLEDWQDDLYPVDSAEGDRSRKRKKRGADTDLQVAKNPKNPYPIYQLILKSEKFTKKELIAGVELLSETDLRLKSSAQNPKLLLESAIYHICRRTGPG